MVELSNLNLERTMKTYDKQAIIVSRGDYLNNPFKFSDILFTEQDQFGEGSQRGEVLVDERISKDGHDLHTLSIGMGGMYYDIEVALKHNDEIYPEVCYSLTKDEVEELLNMDIEELIKYFTYEDKDYDSPDYDKTEINLKGLN